MTGCPPLTDKTDLSCNTYKRGGHLLCHDDVIGTRCVSFILYLSWKGKEWREELGGGLELYPVDASGEGAPVVSHTPSAVVPPQFASMAFFTVQPGRSARTAKGRVVVVRRRKAVEGRIMLMLLVIVDVAEGVGDGGDLMTRMTVVAAKQDRTSSGAALQVVPRSRRGALLGTSPLHLGMVSRRITVYSSARISNPTLTAHQKGQLSL